MTRKTLWQVLTILSIATFFVQAAPSAAGQTEEQPAPPPAWATAATKTAAVTLFVNGFEGDFASEWIVQDVAGSILGEWTQVSSSTSPSATPHGGTYMAKFNSFDVMPGQSTRVYTTDLSLSAPSEPYVGFWMHHNQRAGRSSLQLEVDNGSGWANVGGAIDCQDVTGWQYHVVDLSLYAGDVISLSFKGIADWVSNIYVDDVEVYYEPPADVAVAKSVIPTTPVGPGDAITYTLTFSNAGGLAAGVVITDLVPVSVTNTSVISSGVSITQTNVGVYTYTWEVQDLDTNDVGVITITGVLSDLLPAGTFINTATITTTSTDINGGNDSDSAAITVQTEQPGGGIGGVTMPMSVPTSAWSWLVLVAAVGAGGIAAVALKRRAA